MSQSARGMLEIPGAGDGAIFVFFLPPYKTVQGEEPPVAPIRVEGEGRRNKRSRHTCDLCDKLVIGDLEWTGEGSNRLKNPPSFC